MSSIMLIIPNDLWYWGEYHKQWVLSWISAGLRASAKCRAASIHMQIHQLGQIEDYDCKDLGEDAGLSWAMMEKDRDIVEGLKMNVEWVRVKYGKDDLCPFLGKQMDKAKVHCPKRNLEMQKGHENQEQDWALLSSKGFGMHPGKDWYGCKEIEPDLGVRTLFAVIKASGKDQNTRIFNSP